MKWLRDYFDLSRREETGLWVMIVLIALLFAAQYVWVYLVPERKTDFSELNEWTKKYNEARDSMNSVHQNRDSDFHAVFDFDPNTLDKTGFLKLGLPERIADHINHYREKGGYFRTPDDFRKIYGLSDADYQRLSSHIRISQQTSNPKQALIDLNTADSIKLISIHGIGPIFASRILMMRKGLGAFITKEQLKDVYGINEIKYKDIEGQVTIRKKAIRRFNINTNTLQELKENPYFGYKLASVIVNYRISHGPYQNASDLRKIYAINETLFQKLLPYITVN